MRTLKNSRKILSLLLLGMFFISLLILFDISNTTSPTQTQESLTQDNLIPEQKSPIQDDNPPKPSTPDSASRYNQTFSISQSEDDAFGDNNFLAFPTTFHDTTNITLGVYDINNSTNILLSNEIALRWNITVPKYATITKAYINLTVANLTSFGVPWTGFNTSIYAFNQSSTNDFSNPNELLILRPPTSQIPWELNCTEVIDQTIQTTNIADLIQQVINLDGWNGIFGAYIAAGMGTEDNEAIQFWAYDNGNPKYYPKLFIEWEGIPTFIVIPEDKYVIENNSGHSLKWQLWDDNPHKVKITYNDSILGIPDIKDWTSGWFTYELPALERGFYNFTAYFNDTDGHLIWDSVIVEAGPPKPIIKSGIYKIDRYKDDAWYMPWSGAAITNTGDLILGRSDDKKSLDQRVICLRFNTKVPKHARITRAYVNLTVKTPGEDYDGFTSQIHMFYPPVADFTDDDDNDPFTVYEGGPYSDFIIKMMHYRPWSEKSVEWILPASLSDKEIIQTPEINSSLQEIIDFGSYDGYIGLYIIPTVDVGGINDSLDIYAYPHEKYRPTLFVEWEESPHFVETPSDFTAKNGTRGYYLDWIPADDNPTTFSITCNETVSSIPPGSTINSGVWQSGVENFYDWIHMEMDTSITKIRYDLPPLEIGVYNFTIRINDADSWYNLDSVIVKVKDLDFPVIDLEFIQKGKEVDYFQCGNGPFTVKIYNSSVITPEVILSAYYPGYNQRFYTDGFTSKTGKLEYFFVEIYITGDTVYDNIYNYPNFLSYNPVLGCYKFTPPSIEYLAKFEKYRAKYRWKLVAWDETQQATSRNQDVWKTINDIEYNVLNRFEIRINGIGQYIYNQTIYGGRWARPIKEVWNMDLTPPTYSEPEFIEPDDPNKHYEVNIWAGPEAYGAEVASVFLYYSVNDGPWEETNMVVKDGKYYGEIPAQEEGATIDYYIRITDIAGNSIETDEYHKKAPTFEEPSIIIPILGILLGILGSLSIVAIYRHKSKVALKKLRSEKIPTKSKKGTEIGNKLFQKIKKVKKKNEIK